MGAQWWDGLEEVNGDELVAIQEGEPALRGYLADSAEAMGRVRRGQDITGHPEFGRFYSRADRECFKDEFLAFALKSYSLIGHDRTDGWVDDDFAFFGDWGFELSQIAAPVTIWQGGEDKIIPVAHAEWLAANIPGARLRLYPEEGHISLLVCRFGEMLDELIELSS